MTCNCGSVKISADFLVYADRSCSARMACRSCGSKGPWRYFEEGATDEEMTKVTEAAWKADKVTS